MAEAPGATYFLTASEAYPAFERAFLNARKEVIASFRVFDPTTRLRSDEARAVGDTWADLIRHVVEKGVKITLRISDFDPIVGSDLHHATHLSVKRLRTAVRDSPLLDVQPNLHPAKAGLLPRFLLWPRTYIELRKHIRELRGMTAEKRERTLSNMPALRSLIREDGDTLRVRIFPPPSLSPATHHQKVAVFDAEKLYIGGLDLNERRYDTLSHDQAGEETWHDVQVLLEGPVAREAHAYLTAFASGDDKALQQPSKNLLRTYSTKRSALAPFFMSPKTILHEIEDAHLEAFKTARKLIYFETQFFRYRRLATALCDAARTNPELKVILVLPAAPDDVAFENSKRSDARYGEYLQSKCIDQMNVAFGQRLFVAAAAQARSTSATDRAALEGADLVYVHSKVSIFDNDLAIVSSANLNGRSMRWDTEAGVAITHEADVAKLRSRCFDHWLCGPAENGAADLEGAFDRLRDIAIANLAAAPADRRGFLLPYPMSPPRRFGRNLPGVPEELV
ncbi:phospholipase D-like domain-containing protein [Litoreibacter janthinus]|uniref:Phospholipase D n=1 Tax=Litoreibacter janthinus TaxID=670154 RepID=A0A1I6GBS1_9RHOB|nr:phospholipase D-like domain-containing protein [Litoreibacter janthinus]SFR39635.1 phospholipase D1/2 [Litoreibacter janthinus]